MARTFDLAHDLHHPDRLLPTLRVQHPPPRFALGTSRASMVVVRPFLCSVTARLVHGGCRIEENTLVDAIRGAAREVRDR